MTLCMHVCGVYWPGVCVYISTTKEPSSSIINENKLSVDDDDNDNGQTKKNDS